MAVEDKYVTTKVANRVPAPAAQASGGAQLHVFEAQVAVAAADDDGSVYRLFKALPAELCIHSIRIGCTAITDGTDYDLGFYLTDLGAVIDKDNLMDGQTMASASNMALDGFSNVTVANKSKRLFELAGHTEATKRKEGYDIALTANTVGSVAGTICVKLLAYQG